MIMVGGPLARLRFARLLASQEQFCIVRPVRRFRFVPQSSRLKFAILALCVGAALAGCGRRGPLEPPPNGRDIPGEENAQPGDQTAGTIGNPIGQPQRRNEPIRPPTGPFVLDFLL